MNRKPFLFAGLVLCLVFLADVLVGAVSKQLIWNAPDAGFNQTNTAQALFHREADVLILGASRANHSFDSRIIKDSLGLSAYNAGRDGQNITYAAMVFFSFLERHVPRLLVLDVNSSGMNSDWFEALHEMNCYYGMAQPLDEIVDSTSSWVDRLKLKSNLYKYNNTWQWLLKAYFSKSEARLDGYRPMPVNRDAHFAAVESSEQFTVDSVNLHYLDRMVRACKEHNIAMVVTYTPSMMVSKGNFIPWLAGYCRANQLPFYSWSGDTAYTHHSDYFYDMTHLNERGADKLTREFCHRVKREVGPISTP